MPTSDTIRAAIAAATDSAEATIAVAEREGRELTADEQKSFSAAMDADTGAIPKLQRDLAEAVKHEQEVTRLRAMRAQQVIPQPAMQTAAQQALPPAVRLITPTLTAFKGNGDRSQACRDAFDVGLWFRAILQKDTGCRERLMSRRGPDWFAAWNETTAADGGYLVPTELSNALVMYRDQVGAIRKLAKIVPMSSLNTTIVKQTAGQTVYYPGEAGAITASDGTFATIALAAKKRAILAYVTPELSDDTIIPIMDIVVSDMAHQLALREDVEGITGDGGAGYGSVLGLQPAVVAATASVVTAASGVDTWAELTLNNIATTMSLIASKYRSGQMSFLCSAAYKWQVLDRLAYALGGSFATELVNGVPQDRFLGYPVVVSDQMPTATAVSQVGLLFGSFSEAVVLGDRNEVRLATSEHVGFASDQLAVRATVRYDINVHEEGTTSVTGAIAGLKTAAS